MWNRNIKWFQQLDCCEQFYSDFDAARCLIFCGLCSYDNKAIDHVGLVVGSVDSMGHKRPSFSRKIYYVSLCQGMWLLPTEARILSLRRPFIEKQVFFLLCPV